MTKYITDNINFPSDESDKNDSDKEDSDKKDSKEERNFLYSWYAFYSSHILFTIILLNYNSWF